MGFQSISKGYYSGHRKRARYVIQDEEEWTKIWKQHVSIHHPEAQPAEVDFSNGTVPAVFMGVFPTGGYEIEITEVVDKGNHGCAETCVTVKKLHCLPPIREVRPRSL